MADTGGKVDGGGGDHSSGEYSGIVEQAAVGMNGNAQDIATALTSGKLAQARRMASQKEKEEKAKKKREEEEKAKNL
jgi:hypothetical protein